MVILCALDVVIPGQYTWSVTDHQRVKPFEAQILKFGCFGQGTLASCQSGGPAGL